MAKILVIDDDPYSRLFLKTTLMKGGHEVFEATDGEEGLLAVQKDPPDIIFLDMVMPGMHGWNVCQTLKSNPRTSSIPVIMVTSHDWKTEKSLRMATGCSWETDNFPRGWDSCPDEYLEKPWESAQLQEITEKLLSDRKLKAV